MIRTPAFIVAALTLAASIPVVAHDSSWYALADLGYNHFHQTSSYSQPVNTSAVPDESGGGYRIGGGYSFTDNFALEVNYMDAGHTDIGPDAVLPKVGNQNRYLRIRGVTVDAIGSVRLSNAIDAYMRAGLISAVTERKVFESGSNVQSGPDLTEQDTRLGVGAGAAYRLDDHWTIRVQWQRYFGLGGADTAVRYNLDIATLGVAYYY